MQNNKNQPVYQSILTGLTAERDRVQFLIEPSSIYDFFKKHNVRKIPDYQRPYSWSEQHILDLLNDISKIAEGDRESWFLGPIFTTKLTPNDIESQLLDGQQRVTTIQIIFREASVLLKRIQDLELSSETKLKNKLTRRIDESKKCVIDYGNNDVPEPKFITEESIKQLFHSYICEFDQIETLEDYEKKENEFENKAEEEWKKGSKTANNLKIARKIIKKYLSEKFIKPQLIEGLIAFEKFMDAILKKCWIIEVPLQSIDDSIQIFESLNNRGKSLTLTDKLRYKCLITCEDDIKRSKIRLLWKEIYKNLDFCIDKKFFKNDEDFFKVLFNTLNAESISSEEDMMDLFEQDFKEKGNDGIFNFLDIVGKILDFYINVLNNRLHENNTFTNLFNQNNQKKKVESLLQVLFYAHKISSNSRFLLFKIILESHNIRDLQANFQIIQEIWCLIRIVYIEETLISNKSNIIRNNMLKIIKDLNKDWNLLKYFNDRKDTDYLINKNIINDALQPKDNEESKFIIYLYCYLNEHETLQSYNQKQYKENELEHMFPSSWKNYWEDKYFTKEEITSYIENELEKSQFKNINFENIKIEILQKENLELIDAPNHKQKDSLLQFIGNKWVLHAASNVKASNKNFEFKKDNYQNDSNIIKLPKNENSEIGLNQFEDFTYKEIITRSLRIVDGIFGKFYNTWEDV